VVIRVIYKWEILYYGAAFELQYHFFKILQFDGNLCSNTLFLQQSIAVQIIHSFCSFVN
jgi:hypothetical protein